MRKTKPQAEADAEEAHDQDSPGSLTPKQERALRAVISHPTLKEAALAAGVSEPTLWRYRRDAEFARRLGEAGREAVSLAVARLQGSSGEAVTVLREVMLSEGAPPAARISAARAVFDRSVSAGQIDALRAELEELKEFFRVKQEEFELDKALLLEKEDER